MVYQQLREMTQRADYAELARVAEQISTNTALEETERAFGSLLQAYALLRLDAYRNHEQALAVARPAAAKAASVPVTEYSHWAQLLWAFMLQFVRRDDEAEVVLRQLLSSTDLSVSHRVVAFANLAHSLMMQKRTNEAVAVWLEASDEIDRLPADQRSPGVVRERERIRLNLADHYLTVPDVDAAEGALASLNEQELTPMMRGSLLVSRARIAMMRDEWGQADQLATEAHTLATKVNYQPLRVDALGVLVAVSARMGRRADQQRLVIEMASLAASTQ